MVFGIVLLAFALSPGQAADSPPAWKILEPRLYPGPLPGVAQLHQDGSNIIVSNTVLSLGWTMDDRGLRAQWLRNAHSHQTIALTGEVFQIALENGRRYPASQLAPEGEPRIGPLAPIPGAARRADQIPGRLIEAPLRSADGTLRVVWRALIRDHANYVRQEIEISAVKEDFTIEEIIWMDDILPDARTWGQVDGVPIVAGHFFLGAEDPHALNRVEAGHRVSCRLPRHNPLRGEILTQSFVIGVAPAGQMRRAFLYYLERERAHPYRPFLHYNSWYDVAWAPFALNETNCLEAIRLFGSRLIQPHGIPMDALVFDDGWDDPKTLWQFHSGFPNGFAPLAQACAQQGTRLGIWLSPFGGYGEPKNQRLAFGGRQGYETNATGFSLAGPKYYQAFRDACLGFIRHYGVNHFKFDGIAQGMYASGAAEYLRDTEAMRRLMLELRREDPNLYINLTTGSWPSPFWLRYTDSLWRQGGDMGFAGKGPKQQQWLTYRDQETYQNIVRKSPLYPLNSLMSQGVAYSRQGQAGDPTFHSAGFKDDVRAFFGSGTGLQELYIQPGKLTGADWQVLAEAAEWSRVNADVLIDTHWIGGDPSKLEVYGYASWSPRLGIIMLRNPDDQARQFDLELGAAFELPEGAAREYSLKSPWHEHQSDPSITARAGQPVPIALKPFEVKVLTAVPSVQQIQSDAPETTTLSQSLALIPQPVSLRITPGRFPFTNTTCIAAQNPAAAEAEKLAVWLRSATQLSLPLATESRGGSLIALERGPDLEKRLGPEGYRLAITPERVLIQAPTEAGLFYGGITLRQLLPVEAFAASPSDEVRLGWSLPCLEIEDHPRFAWRGLLLDVARHYMPVGFIKKFIDLAALHKFNRLQLHLTDDQGWRLEIRRYPRLTRIGSIRGESPRRGDRNSGDGVPYGPFFYTQREIRELVEYARARHVVLVPEIEIPGHFRAALAAYPQLSCAGGPFQVRTRWGVEPDVLCPGNPEAVEFALNVLAEVVELFPSPYIHIGGDEAPRDRWKQCPKCQARLRAEGLQHEAQLQTSLNRQLEQFLVAHGRRLLGWDEILEGGLTPGAVVMSWRGTAGGIAAARAGHDVVMSPYSHCYLDYAQSLAPGEPESIGGFIPLAKVYAFEPMPIHLPEARRKHILGAQGNIWTEFIWTPREAEYFAYPRATALAEVVWSPAHRRDWPDFQRRLETHLARLDGLEVRYRRPTNP